MNDLSVEKTAITPVILAGGSGTRLWPLSRAHYPKQFLTLHGEHSLLQQTGLRAAACCDRPAVIVCNEEHRFLTAEQLRAVDIDAGAILLESAARNTAPAIAAAAWQLYREDPNAMMVVMPADHLIDNTAAFSQSVAQAAAAAKDGALVTFGVQPNRPSTGFGYIRASVAGEGALAIEEFVEKPDLDTARRYLEDGNYFWNAGLFVFRADAYLAALQSFEPDMHRLSEQAVARGQADLDFIRLAAEPFEQCRNESIDYAIMEKATDRLVVPFAADWSDVGSWEAVFEAGDADENGNVRHGDTLMQNSRNCYVHAESRLIATLGLEGIGVIETDDSVLVTTLAEAQNAKHIAGILKTAKRSEAETHTRVYRPWGSYESLAMGDRFQVKRIIVKPGARLSLQKHHHRSEHWVVAYGTAIVTIDGVETQLTENQSTYIPLGAVHRMENPGRIPLIIVEVQSGSYLGEDDIVRLEDVYGRGPASDDTSEADNASSASKV